MQTTTPALERLQHVLDAPYADGQPTAVGTWRWQVRQRMAALRDALVDQPPMGGEAWLVARGGSMLRERHALLARLGELSPRVLESPEIEEVRAEIRRLLADISHHIQRVHDLAYDEVELELGGSE